MRQNRAASKLGKLFLAFSLLFGIGVWTSTTAQAQWQNDQYNRQNEREYRREQRRREREARRNQRRQDRDYGNNGYGYGNNGYGYRDADGYGNYGGSFNLRQTALNAGFADGAKEGRKDRERRDRYDYTDEGDYRSGDRDYSSRLGDKEIYRRYYREAFSHGYADGYGGY